MRPTDPELRRGTSKEQFEREQQHYAYIASLARRSAAAKGLEKDLLHEVPLLYGEAACTNGVMADIHRRDMLRKNGGGVYGDYDKREIPQLPYEWVVGVLMLVANSWRIFASYLDI